MCVCLLCFDVFVVLVVELMFVLFLICDVSCLYLRCFWFDAQVYVVHVRRVVKVQQAKLHTMALARRCAESGQGAASETPHDVHNQARPCTCKISAHIPICFSQPRTLPDRKFRRLMTG